MLAEFRGVYQIVTGRPFGDGSFINAMLMYNKTRKKEALDLMRSLSNLTGEPSLDPKYMTEPADPFNNTEQFGIYVVRQGFYLSTEDEGTAKYQLMDGTDIVALKELMPRTVDGADPTKDPFTLLPDYNQFLNQLLFYDEYGRDGHLNGLTSESDGMAGVSLGESSGARYLGKGPPKKSGTTTASHSDEGGKSVRQIIGGSTTNENVVLANVMRADLTKMDMTTAIDTLARCFQDLPWLKTIFTMTGHIYCDWRIWAMQDKELNLVAIDLFNSFVAAMSIEVWMTAKGYTGPTEQYLAEYHAALWSRVFKHSSVADPILVGTDSAIFSKIFVPDESVFVLIQLKVIPYMRHYVMSYDMSTNEPLDQKTKLQLDAAWDDMTHVPLGHYCGVWYYGEVIKKERSSTTTLAVDHYEQTFINFQRPEKMEIKVGRFSINIYLDRLLKISALLAKHDKTKLKSDQELLLAMMRFFARCSFVFDNVDQQFMQRDPYFQSISVLAAKLSELTTTQIEGMTYAAADDLRKMAPDVTDDNNIFIGSSVEKIKDRAHRALDVLKRKNDGIDVLEREKEDVNFPYYEQDRPHASAVALLTDHDCHVAYEELSERFDNGELDDDVVEAADEMQVLYAAGDDSWKGIMTELDAVLTLAPDKDPWKPSNRDGRIRANHEKYGKQMADKRFRKKIHDEQDKRSGVQRTGNPKSRGMQQRGDYYRSEDRRAPSTLPSRLVEEMKAKEREAKRLEKEQLKAPPRSPDERQRQEERRAARGANRESADKRFAAQQGPTLFSRLQSSRRGALTDNPYGAADRPKLVGTPHPPSLRPISRQDKMMRQLKGYSIGIDDVLGKAETEGETLKLSPALIRRLKGMARKLKEMADPDQLKMHGMPEVKLLEDHAERCYQLEADLFDELYVNCEEAAGKIFISAELLDQVHDELFFTRADDEPGADVDAIEADQAMDDPSFDGRYHGYLTDHSDGSRLGSDSGMESDASRPKA